MQIPEAIIFYLVAFTALAGACGAIFAHKIIYSVLCAFLSFSAVGLLFFALELPYLGAAQIALYAIGISIIFVFALMLTHQNKESELWVSCKPRCFLAVLGLSIVSALILMFLRFSMLSIEGLTEGANEIVMPSSTDIAIDMFITYGAPFVFTTVFFMAAILGFKVMISAKQGDSK